MDRATAPLAHKLKEFIEAGFDDLSVVDAGVIPGTNCYLLTLYHPTLCVFDEVWMTVEMLGSPRCRLVEEFVATLPDTVKLPDSKEGT